jgi:hypothetical protein
MDNRELANSELSKLLDSGFLSIRNNKSNSISELPQSETPDEQTSYGNSTNNFNVVVNVSGNSKTVQPAMESKNIVNNILRNDTNQSPSDIKKNYNESLKENLNLIPDNFNITDTNLINKSYSDMNLINNSYSDSVGYNNILLEKNETFPSKNLINNSYSDSVGYNNILLEKNETFPSKSFESNLEILKTISNSTNNVTRENLGVDVSDVNQNSITNYSFSSAEVKNKNNTLNIAFENINNSIKHSLGVNGDVSGTVLNNELLVDRKTNQLNVYKSTVEVNNQNITPLEEMDNKIRELDRNEKIRTKLAERSTLQMMDSKDRKESEDIDLSDQMQDTVAASKTDYSDTPFKESINRDISHINSSDVSNEYVTFINKMNNPPTWRVVLG